MPDKPLAYFITFSCYGHRFHGDATWSVDRRHRSHGQPPLEENPALEAYEMRLMLDAPYELDAKRGRIVIDGLADVCRRRDWRLRAVHVRSNHVHVVVGAGTTPERVMVALKAYASRYLNASGLENAKGRRWAEHGSTIYLWSDEDVASAMAYVLRGQGEPMAVYEESLE